MLFLGLVMMPFYYISKTYSVPGYLHLRFGNPARAFSAVSFAFMTILMSGINMYSMALVMKVVLGWDLNFSIWLSSLVVAIYVALGGLRSAIFNEILQFVLIWAGALLIPILGMIEVGGWRNLTRQIEHNLGRSDYTHLWSTLGHFKDNPMGVHWTGIVLGWGFVLSFGYWTTDFLVVQRVLAANSLRLCTPRANHWRGLQDDGAADRHPSRTFGVGRFAFPLLPEGVAVATNGHSYNEVLPLMLVRYCGPGLIGLGVTALIAGFMSGMAGNVSAFSTVWTYDIYGAFLNKKASDRHYVAMGRWCTLVGVLVSVGTAYLVQHSASIMDYACSYSAFCRTAIRHCNRGHAVAARDQQGGLLGAGGRHPHFDRPMGLGGKGPLSATLCCAFPGRERDGGKHVPRIVGVDGLRWGHDSGQPGNEAAARL